MKRRLRLRGPAPLALAVFALLNLALIGASAAGLRVNTTASMPLGIYRIGPRAPGLPVRDSVVVVCPSPAVITAAAGRGYLSGGPCPGNVEPLLKHVAAVAGDTVSVSDRGVAVNGRALPNSARLRTDCAGRPLARIAPGRYTLAADAVWLYAPVAHSWDSRYFGAQPAGGTPGVATPVLIVGAGRACG